MTFFHVGTECDGRWVKGPFKTLEEANASLTEYTGEHSDRLNATTPPGRRFESDIGGYHFVTEKYSMKTARSVELYLDAADARECGIDTKRDRIILARHEEWRF